MWLMQGTLPAAIWRPLAAGHCQLMSALPQCFVVLQGHRTANNDVQSCSALTMAWCPEPLVVRDEVLCSFHALHVYLPGASQTLKLLAMVC
jgi:hypothetical protein